MFKIVGVIKNKKDVRKVLNRLDKKGYRWMMGEGLTCSNMKKMVKRDLIEGRNRIFLIEENDFKKRVVFHVERLPYKGGN